MKLPQRVYYGLVFLLQLHFSYPDFIPVKEVAEAEGMPQKFLEGIATELKHEKMVEVRRGVKGGYRLVRSLDQVSLMEVIRCLAPEWEGTFSDSGTTSQRSKSDCVSLFLSEAAVQVVRSLEKMKLDRLLELYSEDRSLLYYI